MDLLVYFHKVSMVFEHISKAYLRSPASASMESMESMDSMESMESMEAVESMIPDLGVPFLGTPRNLGVSPSVVNTITKMGIVPSWYPTRDCNP